LPDGSDPLELADVEAVQAHQIPWSGREQAEPVGLHGPGCHQARVRRGQCCERGHPQPSGTEVVAVQHLVDPGGGAQDLTLLQVLEEPSRSQGGPGDRLGQDDLLLVGGDRVGHRRPHEPGAASMTALAIGAATLPPVASLPRLPPFSTTTATTMCGSWAGANPTNHACGVVELPCCAVPVFPATSMPGIWAAVPVP